MTGVAVVTPGQDAAAFPSTPAVNLPTFGVPQPNAGSSTGEQSKPGSPTTPGKDFSAELGLGQSGAAPAQTPQAGKDFSTELGLPQGLKSEDTNDQILAKLGYSDEDIAALKTDPIYKASTFTDGPNFLSKEIAAPGSLMESIGANPDIGGFAHGFSTAALQTARYMALGLTKLGAMPETSPAMLDAMARVSDAAYNQARATQPQEPDAMLGISNDSIPQFLGALGLPAGGLTGLTKGVVGALGKPALASRLMAAGGSLIEGTALGAATAPMFNSSFDIKPSVGKEYNDAYADKVGTDAEWGAVFGAGAHLMVKGAFKAVGLKNQAEASARIEKILNTVRGKALEMGHDEQAAVLDKLAPLFRDKEYAERELNFALNNVQPTYSDVAKTGFSTKTERVARSLPFGLGNFRDKVQQKQVKDAVQKFSAHYYDKMINTKWGDLTELEEAAKGTGDYAKRAKEVLEILKNETGTESGRAIKADLGARQVRRLLIKAKLYAKRDALAGNAFVRNEKPLAVVKKGLAELSNSALPNTGLIRELSQVGTDLENGPASQTYSRYINSRNAISDLVGKYGGNADRILINLKEAFDAAIEDFHTGATKYAKSERYGIQAKNTAPFFKPSRGGGYDFSGFVKAGTSPSNPEGVVYFGKDTEAAMKRVGTGRLGPSTYSDSDINILQKYSDEPTPSKSLRSSTQKVLDNSFSSTAKTVYRGAYEDKSKLSVGGLKPLSEVTSTSNEKDIAYSFIHDKSSKGDRVLYEINVPAGSRVVDLNDAGVRHFASDENESILSGGTALRITSIEDRTTQGEPIRLVKAEYIDPNKKPTIEDRQVSLRSPVIVEKGQGLEDFKAKLGLPADVSDEDLTKAAIEYAKGNGNDGVVLTKNGTPRTIIDLSGWKREIGDANARANKFMKEQFGPPTGQGGMMEGKQNLVQQALKTQPDQIVKQFIKEGQADKAKVFFNSLGPRGQAAVRSSLIDNAIEAGTDVNDKINPKKVSESLFKFQDPNKVFFQGEDRWKLDGFLKLLEHASEAGPANTSGGHFVSGLLAYDFVKDVGEGLLRGQFKAALGGALTEAGGVSLAGKALSSFAKNEKIRHILLAANSAKPGSLTMEKLYKKLRAEKATTELLKQTASEVDGGNQQ